MDDDGPAVTWCPSGKARAPESVALGVRSGETGQISYLAYPVPAADVLPAIPEDVDPKRIIRFASHCESTCANKVGNDCTLVNRLMKLPAESTATAVPRCHLRPKCQWWHQIGVGACHRCPAVITTVTADEELRMLVADPATTLDQVEIWIAERERDESKSSRA